MPSLKPVSSYYQQTHTVPTVGSQGQGEKDIKENSNVIIRGRRVKDLTGIKYTLIRGKLDFAGMTRRKTSRSKYGTKNIKKYV